MPARLITISDIHGYAKSLAVLLDAIDPKPDDVLVPLGDYCDRGPDTKGTIQRLIELAGQCRLVPLLGNHDEVVLDLLAGKRELFPDWLTFGGNTTLFSYDCAVPEQIPAEHIDFLKSCRLYYETDSCFFVHASYLADKPLQDQPRRALLWESLRDREPGPHCSGRMAYVGHTAQRDGEILDLGYLKCIDTYCYGGGWLTALDVASGRIWQADSDGQLRRQETGPEEDNAGSAEPK